MHFIFGKEPLGEEFVLYLLFLFSTTFTTHNHPHLPAHNLFEGMDEIHSPVFNIVSACRGIQLFIRFFFVFFIVVVILDK